MMTTGFSCYRNPQQLKFSAHKKAEPVIDREADPDLSLNPTVGARTEDELVGFRIASKVKAYREETGKNPPPAVVEVWRKLMGKPVEPQALR